MTDAAARKTMTEGEAGLVMAFSILALLALAGAAKAEDTAFAFHAYLTAAASIAVVFGILILILMFKPSGILGVHRKEKV